MLRSLYVTMVYIAFLIMGVAAPFVLSLGYVWVDSFDPQDVATQFLNQFPVSKVVGGAAILSFLLLDRRKGGVSITSVLLAVFAVWITLSTALWAEVPVPAWIKWDYAVKTLCFAAFMPFVFRSRVQIEAFLQIYLFSVALHFLPVGIKTLYSGGGYGMQLDIVTGNSLLAEGSTLASVALMLVPIIVYLRRHSLILPRGRVTGLLYAGLAVVAVAAAIGTYERTALIGMVTVGIGLWLGTKRKLLFGSLGLAAMLGVATFTSDAWTDRIATLRHFDTEGSALGRILAWKWTLGYVADHPFGGGFNAYLINTITFPPGPDGTSLVVHGKAYHSIYFEVLGEQGWVGLGLFGALIATALIQLNRVSRRTRNLAGLAWAHDLAFALRVSLVTLLACGSFIGIAFQPMLYYVLTISACLHQHLRCVERLATKPLVVPAADPWCSPEPA